LRRNGVSYSDKFGVTKPSDAIYGGSNYGPTFGGGFDIYVRDNSNSLDGSYTYFSDSYTLPAGYTYQASNTKSFLAGCFNDLAHYRN
jgi:hypothetical protein